MTAADEKLVAKPVPADTAAPGNARAETLLIVNADDLGRTSGVNAGVFEAHRRGIVTSATLMVAYPAAVEAAAALAEHPGLGVGLHVALTGGRPVLPAERVPSLIDADGRLPRDREGLASADPAEVLAEVRAQLDRFRRLTGRLPTHLDGHHHCHRVPAVLEAVVAVAVEHRLPVRDAGPPVRARLDEAGVATTDRFVDRFFGEGARLEVLLEILDGLEPGSTELMCHPGLADEELLAGSTYAVERERELAILTHPEVLAAVRSGGIRLAHFGDLAALRGSGAGAGSGRRPRPESEPGTRPEAGPKAAPEAGPGAGRRSGPREGP